MLKTNAQDLSQKPFFTPLHSGTMALTSKELIHEKIKIQVTRVLTISIVAWLTKHQRPKDNRKAETVDTADITQNCTACAPTLGLLSIPLQIRLQIFGYLLRVDTGRICPHARLPYFFVHHEHSPILPVPNDILLPALLINRQLYFEVKLILYSENLFYFQRCLTLDPCWFGFPGKLLAAIGTNIRQIGFALHSFAYGPAATREASINAAGKLKAEFKLLSTHLPSLNITRVDLFFKIPRPCQRFLVCLVPSCQLL